MHSIAAVEGPKHTVNRDTIYDDVIKLYRSDRIVEECPLQIEYNSEIAVDEGGVTRDMFSAFWEESYNTLFDGATILIPLIHSRMDMDLFPILGKIISHGYLAGGHLPVRISLPSLLCILLGPTTDIPKSFLLDALIDYISPSERLKLQSALQYKNIKSFSTEILSDLISILSRFGCREIPTPTTLPQIIVNSSRYEFCCKPSSAIAMMNCGIPIQHKSFWIELGVDGISELYTSLTVMPEKVLKMLSCASANSTEERVFGYLTSMVGNMGVDDLRNFLRFCTGSSVCVIKSISIEFNSSSGFARRPFAHTCGSILELPVSYMNYHDFSAEWSSILSDTGSNWKWRMDSR